MVTVAVPEREELPVWTVEMLISGISEGIFDSVSVADWVMSLNFPATKAGCGVEVNPEDWKLGDERSQRSMVSTSSSYNHTTERKRSPLAENLQ